MQIAYICINFCRIAPKVTLLCQMTNGRQALCAERKSQTLFRSARDKMSTIKNGGTKRIRIAKNQLPWVCARPTLPPALSQENALTAVAATPEFEAPSQDTAFLGHPKGLGYLAVVEGCERFSYYSMQTLLVLYMVKYLLLSEHI